MKKLHKSQIISRLVVLKQLYEQRIGCKKTKTPQLIWVAALKNQNKKFILKVVEHCNGEKIHKSGRTCISIGDERMIWNAFLYNIMNIGAGTEENTADMFSFNHKEQ